MDDSNDWIYPQLEKNPHGLCIIFNNYFDGDNYREWTDIDKDNLNATFTSLGYEIIVHNNYPAQTIKDELNHYCLGYSEEIDSLFVCFLTHGGENYICGNDYKPIRYSELSNIFSQNGCVFKNIPKVVINQACSGGTSFGRGQDAVNTNVFNNSFVSNNQGLSERNPIFENKDYENYKDFMILSASSPGMPSLRTEDGSPFVHYLCKVLDKHAYEHSFDEMVTLLRIEMGKSSCNIKYGVGCTPPTPHGTLDKRLFLYPIDTANAMINEYPMVKEENFSFSMAIEDYWEANKEISSVTRERIYHSLPICQFTNLIPLPIYHSPFSDLLWGNVTASSNSSTADHDDLPPGYVYDQHSGRVIPCYPYGVPYNLPLSRTRSQSVNGATAASPGQMNEHMEGTAPTQIFSVRRQFSKSNKIHDISYNSQPWNAEFKEFQFSNNYFLNRVTGDDPALPQETTSLTQEDLPDGWEVRYAATGHKHNTRTTQFADEAYDSTMEDSREVLKEIEAEVMKIRARNSNQALHQTPFH